MPAFGTYKQNDLINKAIIFATKAHGDQVRKGKGDVPYIFHPLDVASEIMFYSGLRDGDLVKATLVAILHDVYEDTDFTLDDIQDEFGKEISEMVDLLSSDKEISEDSEFSKKNSLIKKLEKLSKGPLITQMVKLADRNSNLKTFPSFWSAEKIENYLDESVLISKIIGSSSDVLNARLMSRIHESKVMLSLFESKS